jgi:DNA-binding NarL/FixJ family response regulator
MKAAKTKTAETPSQTSTGVTMMATATDPTTKTQGQPKEETMGTETQERRRGGDRRNAGSKTRIVIVDGHTLFRRGVRNILELENDMEVVGEAGSGREALATVEELTPDVVLMDLSLPAPNGIETTQRLKRELPHTGVIVLAPGDDEDQLFDAIKAGAAAYVLKDIDPTDLIAIIRRVRSGEYLINDKVFAKPAVATRVLKEFRELAVYGSEAQPIFAPLSPREVEILDNIAQGMTNKQVAYALSISEQTVKNHMSSILRKLAVNDRTQAVVYAMRQGWIKIPED